jgi:hypothetical protein
MKHYLPMSKFAIRALVCFALVAATIWPLGLGETPEARASTLGKNGRLAFVSPLGAHGSDIWVSAPDGSEPVSATALSTAAGKLGGPKALYQEPTWSPEGGPHIAFILRHAPGSRGVLYWMNPGGSVIQQVTSTAVVDASSPTFSPGGGHIAFSGVRIDHGRPAGPADILAQTLQGFERGLEIRRLVDDSRFRSSSDISPAWSQDSSMLVFASNLGSDGTAQRDYGLWMVFLQDRECWKVCPVIKVTDQGTNPQWHPNQRWIVYQRADGNIWKVGFDEASRFSGHPQRLTDFPASGPPAVSPQFTPQGDAILFDRGNHVYKMQANGDSLRRLPQLSTTNAVHPDQEPECHIGATDGPDKQIGTDRPELFCWSDGNDTAWGKGGNDVIFGGTGASVYHGGPGDDLIQGGGGNSIAGDVIFGDAGDDYVTGTAVRSDDITGGPGADRIVGESGNDVLDGRDGVAGNDIVNGGEGNDLCFLNVSRDGRTRDRIVSCERTVEVVADIVVLR